MSNYEYKTIPAPMLLEARNQKKAEESIRGYSAILNREAQDGWEFFSMEGITTRYTPGFFGWLFGKKVTMVYHMLVFRRPNS